MSMTSDRPRGGLALTAFAAVALLLFPASAATVQDVCHACSFALDLR